jgi:hypothetical protein
MSNCHHATSVVEDEGLRAREIVILPNPVPYMAYACFPRELAEGITLEDLSC